MQLNPISQAAIPCCNRFVALFPEPWLRNATARLHSGNSWFSGWGFRIQLRFGKDIHMSTSNSSASGYATPAFWERLWRTAGIQFVVLFIVAYFIYGSQPQVGASADALIKFYDGERTRILVAAVITGFAILNLLWFAAARFDVFSSPQASAWCLIFPVCRT
jgi:hypothetical protein